MWVNLAKKNKKNLDNIPQKAGIYKFYDENGKLLYIGKALNLKARVSSYFRQTHRDRPHILVMLPLVKKIKIVETDNEVESLILESALVKKYQPKFNMELKDDKSFSWIYISTQDKFPRVSIVRSIKKGEYEKGKLFGPYPKGKVVKNIFNYIRKIYPFCTCKNPKDLCLYYHLDLCPGPYHGKISQEKYMENIDNIVKFLNGKKKNMIKDLEKDMKYYAKSEDFEKAMKLRDKISDLEYMSQKIYASPYEDEIEYVNSRYERMRNSLELLEKKIGSKKIKRIECYDISNIQGRFAYGSMSVSLGVRLRKEEYRIFKIKEESIDDIAMLKDVLKRRLVHIGVDSGDESLNTQPDLMLIDGGKGHLSVLGHIVPNDIALLAISKGKHMKKKNMKSKDEFWWFDNGSVKKIDIKYPTLFVNLRDEAHRFGIKHYRKNIRQYSTTSALDKIEGVGVKRRKLLLKHFKSLEKVTKATAEELNKVVKNKKVAKSIYEEFKSQAR